MDATATSKELWVGKHVVSFPPAVANLKVAIASGDGFSWCYDEIVADVPNKTKCTDDTLLWANDITSSFFQAVDWLYLWQQWYYPQP